MVQPLRNQARTKKTLWELTAKEGAPRARDGEGEGEGERERGGGEEDEIREGKRSGNAKSFPAWVTFAALPPRSNFDRAIGTDDDNDERRDEKKPRVALRRQLCGERA